MKKALITGITGQDGSYLAELLLFKGYEVFGIIRRSSSFNTARIDHLYKDPHEPNPHLKLVYGDLNDASSLNAVLRTVQPDEIYNLAAQSHVKVSFDIPEYTGEVTGLGTLRLLETIRDLGLKPKFYQASCYDDQTRVLTTKGLKTYKEVSVGDLVFTVNTTRNELEVKAVRRVIASPYQGTMVRLKSRRFNLLVTPNHQLLLHGTTGLFYSFAGNLQVPDREHFYPRLSSVKFPNPIWVGKRQTSIRLSQVAPCEFPCNARKNLIDEIETNDLFWLTGLYVGDGYCSPNKRTLRSGTKEQFMALRDQQGHFITQSRVEAVTYPSHNLYFAIPLLDKSRRRLVLWLEKYGIEYHAAQEWIRFSSYPLAHFLRTCGTSAKAKHIPPWMLAYDREHLQALFEGLIGSDGHIRRNRKTYTYTTISRALLDQVVELSVKLGLRCSTSRKRGPDVLYIKEQRIIPASQAYVAQISDNHRKRPITLYPSHVQSVPYAGTVWCLEVEDNHNFLVERNGQYAFCGNSSELFGKAQEVPQKETTPFYPRSPYGCAKAYAFHITRNYREAYGLHASNGILFNHECVTADTPVVIRRNGIIEIVAIEDIVPHRTDSRHGLNYTTVPTEEIDVWDGDRWARITCTTATWNNPQKAGGKTVRRICARGAVFSATENHVCFRKGGREIRCGNLRVGDDLELKELPPRASETVLTEDEAWFMGSMVADGWSDGDGDACFVNQDSSYVEQVGTAWKRITGEWVNLYEAKSGFPKGNKVLKLNLRGASGYGRWLTESIYTRSGEKKVPGRILNAPSEIQRAFLRGYNMGDGLQAGNGDYEFKSFKTKSSVLAAGLFWLAQVALKQRAIVCVEERDGQTYYQINLNSPDPKLGGKGQHLKRPLEEIAKIKELTEPGWLFDLATESGTFSAGVGLGWIHNSPRRGETFVSRKITRAATRIKVGLQETLYLGNLEAKRDWGYAPEYIEAMWQMLQQETPDDFVIATGQTHSVKEFVEETFGLLGLDWRGYVKVDPRYLRPTEVDLLVGDASKAHQKLGWKPRVTFKELVRIMAEADLELAQREAHARQFSGARQIAVGETPAR